MGGIMGKYIWSIPAIVIIALIASLVECLFILPSHLAESINWAKRKVDWYDPLIRAKDDILGDSDLSLEIPNKNRWK